MRMVAIISTPANYVFILLCRIYTSSDPLEQQSLHRVIKFSQHFTRCRLLRCRQASAKWFVMQNPFVLYNVRMYRRRIRIKIFFVASFIVHHFYRLQLKLRGNIQIIRKISILSSEIIIQVKNWSTNIDVRMSSGMKKGSKFIWNCKMDELL